MHKTSLRPVWQTVPCTELTGNLVVVAGAVAVADTATAVVAS